MKLRNVSAVSLSVIASIFMPAVAQAKAPHYFRPRADLPLVSKHFKMHSFVSETSTEVSRGVPQPRMATPLWFQQAYDLTALSSTAGAGQTVAIYIASSDPTLEANLATFRSHYDLSPCTSAGSCLSFIDVNTTAETTPTAVWDEEASLDVDTVSALCPNCHIMVIEDDTGSLQQDAETAKAAGATVMSISAVWGAEAAITDPGSILPSVAATGDWGADASPSLPIGNSDVTAAGGTSLLPNAASPRGYNEYAWGRCWNWVYARSRSLISG
jgi:subtilase family serine protease